MCQCATRLKRGASAVSSSTWRALEWPCDSCATWSASAHTARRQQCAARPHRRAMHVAIRAANRPAGVPRLGPSLVSCHILPCGARLPTFREEQRAGIPRVSEARHVGTSKLECFDAVRRKSRCPSRVREKPASRRSTRIARGGDAVFLFFFFLPLAPFSAGQGGPSAAQRQGSQAFTGGGWQWGEGWWSRRGPR